VEGHDRFERQGRWVCVVAVGDALDRLAQNLDRRLGDVLVAIRRTGLAQVLELPGIVLTSFGVGPWLYASEIAERFIGRWKTLPVFTCR